MTASTSSTFAGGSSANGSAAAASLAASTFFCCSSLYAVSVISISSVFGFRFDFRFFPPSASNPLLMYSCTFASLTSDALKPSLSSCLTRPSHSLVFPSMSTLAADVFLLRSSERSAAASDFAEAKSCLRLSVEGERACVEEDGPAVVSCLVKYEEEAPIRPFSAEPNAVGARNRAVAPLRFAFLLDFFAIDSGSPSVYCVAEKCGNEAHQCQPQPR